MHSPAPMRAPTRSDRTASAISAHGSLSSCFGTRPPAARSATSAGQGPPGLRLAGRSAAGVARARAAWVARAPARM
eukprot:4504782-Alexandrium_andersonii.AAC.1